MSNSGLKMNKSRHSLGTRRSLSAVNENSPLRRKSLGTVPVVSVDLPENDDAAERERISSTTVERGSSVSVGEKSTSLVSALSGLTADEMTDHYVKCMKLSSENKINTKNAFSLQLIDYMATVFKKKTFDSSNFQVASVALDAGAKIYGYRVDNVHEAVLKMAGALAQEKKKKVSKDDQEENDENAPEDQADASSKRKKKPRRRKNVLAEDPSLLNAKEDVAPRTDPYFQRFVTSVGESQEGNCNFLNKLKVEDDSSKLLLFPELPLWPGEVSQVTSVDRERGKSTLPHLPANDWRTQDICCAFSHFSFNNWSLDMEERMSVNSIRACEMDGIEPLATPARLQPDEDYAFDMDAEVGPVNDGHFDNSDDDVSLEVGVACTAVDKSKQDVIVDVRKHLSVVPQEYSFFQGNLMSLWAGPNHWKIVPLTRGKVSSVSCKANARGTRRRKVMEVDFEKIDMVVLQGKFSPGKGIKLSRKTMLLWSSDKTTLPQDEHFDPSVFYRLELRCCVSVKRVDHNSSQVIDDDVDGYNYDNDNDRQSFCPDLHLDDDPQGDDAPSQTYEGSMMPSQDVHNTDSQPMGTFTGDNLVAPPQKVARIWIPYALKAKQMDMKKLKDKIWHLLITLSLAKDVTPVVNADRMAGEVPFSKVYHTLPTTLSHAMRENLSFPLAMFAVLHLANEKNLHLSHFDDLSDFRISQT